MQLQWTAELATGIEALDRQHFEAACRANSFLFLCADCASSPQATHIALSHFRDHVEEHFQFEELLMNKHRYPATDSHRRAHDQFREWIGSSVERLAGGGSPPDFSPRLVRRLERHLQHEDSRFAKFLQPHLCQAR